MLRLRRAPSAGIPKITPAISYRRWLQGNLVGQICHLVIGPTHHGPNGEKCCKFTLHPPFAISALSWSTQEGEYSPPSAHPANPCRPFQSACSISHYDPQPQHNLQCRSPPVGRLCRQPSDLPPDPCRRGPMFSEAGIMATALCLDRFYRLVPLPFHRRRVDSWCWDDHRCRGVFPRYISLHHILWDLKVLYISLSE